MTARRRCDVVILGAGAAGLIAARELRRKGTSFIVVEARDRVGGRVLGASLSGTRIELGAEFVHGRAPLTRQCLREAGLSTVEVPDTHRWRQGSRLTPIPRFWERMGRTFERVSSRGGDLPFAAELRKLRDLSARDRALARSFVEGFHAADADRASAREISGLSFVATDAEERRVSRVLEGYSSLLEPWGRRLGRCLQLSSPVSRIQWKKGQVIVCTPRSEIRARQAIVTLPVSTLERIQWEPRPRALKRALSGVTMGHVIKLMLGFRAPIWEKRGTGLSFVHATDGEFQVFWTAAPLDWPVLTAWVGGPRAASFDLLPVSVRRERALASAARALMLPLSWLRREHVATRFHDWSRDPYSRGAYSYVMTGGADGRHALDRPIQDTLFFAGEAWHEEQSGTVEGALATGLRAARRIQ